jgi:DNA-binding NtrC family response regulator
MEKTPSILVVDDEEYIRQIIEGYLLVEGFSIRTAVSAAEAKTAAQETAFDLLITDFKMPGEDGISLARYFRKHHPQTGIILVTGFPQSETLKTIEELEISSLLVKPFTAHQLKFSVLGALEKLL